MTDASVGSSISLTFSERVIAWQLKNGRQHLPWQGDNAYHVWLSEIMLQQTQVVKVIDYFERFIAAFPDIETLAAADEQAVMALWSGLGYYNRARNLHKASQICADQYNNTLPVSMAELEKLAGIGRTTAAAIRSLAFEKAEPILDGNVKRVFARYFLIAGEPNNGTTLKKFWAEAERQQTDQNPRAYSQGLMDLGSLICTKHKPKCPQCPVQLGCRALAEDVIGDYPEKKKPAKTKAVDLWVYLALKDNQVHLNQRPEKGIWSKMWFLPEFNDAQSLQKAHPKASHFMTLEHKLTHRDLTIHVYTSTETQIPISHDNLLKLPHPTALKHILDYYDNHNLP